MSDQSLILAPKVDMPEVEASAVALQIKDRVLEASALIAMVKTADQNKKCFEARRQIEQLSRDLERERKKITDPINDWLRKVKSTVDTEKEELDRESGRLARLEREFNDAEKRRVWEEQEAQRRELERIEREMQAELARIAREQAEAERKAQEAAESAARQASEAKNEEQRKAAEAARVEAQRQADEAARVAAAQTQSVEESAEFKTYIESKPVEITKAKGQTFREVWVVDQINDHQLYKARPDLARTIEWDKTAINAALDAGQTLPGVKAHKESKAGSRGRVQHLIDV